MISNQNGKSLEDQLQILLDRRSVNSTLRNLTLPRSNQTDFSSNDFLSLSTSSHLKFKYLSELSSTGLPLGSSGSRLLDGNSTYAEELERSIAGFHGAEAGLLFNSGFDANAGFFACVPQPGDVIVYDELVHASVHDGMKLSRASKTVSFRHNCCTSFRTVLEEVIKQGEKPGNLNCKNVIVAVESIYSMDGDVAPLRELVDAMDEILGTGKGCIVVDEAHSTGVLGPKGSGLVCELGLETRIFARLHTFGKALAGNGAIILGSHTLRKYLINYARPLIYTTFLSYPSLALIRASYQMMQSAETVSLQKHLHQLTYLFFNSLRKIHGASNALQTLLKVPSACPMSPIFAIHLQEPKKLARYLQDQDMMVRAVVPPTVALGTQRVRICLHAGNTASEVEKLIQTIKDWCEQRITEEVADPQIKTSRARI
ncbi:PLP-dependent transferase [Pyrenochaeta sp. DS3sAY3a]|nr:PLP-dependent transferase [Pyrenochaeta sp. DS3sAY3a]